MATGNMGFPLPFGQVNPVQFLDGVFTVDSLMASNPASAGLVGTYARVSDLFGEKFDLVLCSSYGAQYFWQPVRPFWARPATTAQLAQIQAGTFSLVPLKVPSLLRIPPSFTLNASQTIPASTANAWPGCQFQVANDGVLGLNTLTITGLDVGSTLAVLLNGRPSIYFDGAAYQKY